MAMIVAAGIISCLVSSWMMSHFGKKPVNGGSPASESKVSIIAAFSIGIFVQDVISVGSLRALRVLRVRNTAAVIKE